MNDMMQQISSLLGDPESADKIKDIAASLGGGEGFTGDSREVALLSAIKPYMRPERAGKIDAAIRAVGMLRMLRNFKGL